MVVKLLLKKGAKLETKDKGGWTPLLYAIGNEHNTVVKLLLVKNSVNLDLRDNFSQTLLLRAAMFKHVAVITLLFA